MTVYEWSVFNLANNSVTHVKRKGTLKAIATRRGTPILETAEEVADEMLDEAGFLKGDMEQQNSK